MFYPNILILTFALTIMASDNSHHHHLPSLPSPLATQFPNLPPRIAQMNRLLVELKTHINEYQQQVSTSGNVTTTNQTTSERKKVLIVEMIRRLEAKLKTLQCSLEEALQDVVSSEENQKALQTILDKLPTIETYLRQVKKSLGLVKCWQNTNKVPLERAAFLTIGLAFGLLLRPVVADIWKYVLSGRFHPNATSLGSISASALNATTSDSPQFDVFHLGTIIIVTILIIGICYAACANVRDLADDIVFRSRPCCDRAPKLLEPEGRRTGKRPRSRIKEQAGKGEASKSHSKQSTKTKTKKSARGQPDQASEKRIIDQSDSSTIRSSASRRSKRSRSSASKLATAGSAVFALKDDLM